MIFIRLVQKNVKTQFKNYLIYSLSMACSVMVYYSFISMSLDQSLLQRLHANRNLAATLQASGAMIALFIFVFMYIANSLFINKRKNELGLYSLLGMRRYQIGLMIFLENLVLGLFSLIIGLILGIIFSKLFSMMLVKALSLEMDSRFVFNLGAVEKTARMYLIILFLVSLRGIYLVYRYNLIDLFRSATKGERYIKVTLFTWLIGFLGIFLVCLGYYRAAHLSDYTMILNQHYENGMGLFFGVIRILAYCVSGTYFIFYGFLPIVLVMLQKIKSFYYRDIHMMTTGNLRFNFRKNAMLLGTIAVLSGTAIAAIGGATNVYSFGIEAAEKDNPVNFIVDETLSDELVTKLNSLEREKSNLDQVNLPITLLKGEFVQTFSEEQTTAKGPFNIISEKNYADLQAINPHLKTLAKLKETEVVYLEGVVYGGQGAWNRTFSTIKFEGFTSSFKVKNVMIDELGGRMRARYNLPTFIMAESQVDKLKGQKKYTLSFIRSHNKLSDEAVYKKVVRKFPPAKLRLIEDNDTIYEEKVPQAMVKRDDYLGLTREVVVARYPDLQNNRTQFGLLVYTAIFLGSIFLIATGSIIMLKQLSEAEEERSRYQMLRKLGVTQSQIKGSIYRQNALVFFVPIIIAALHGKYALVALSYLLPSSNQTLTWLARGIMLVIYLIFYLSTVSNYNKIVNKS